MTDVGRVQGRVAIVTGGAKGIGRACGERLAEEGAAVVLADVDAAALESTGRAIAASGRRVVTSVGDVTEEAQAAAVVAAALAHFGRVDILVNNVGGSRYAKVWEMTVEDWDLVIRLNLRGTFLCTRAAVPHMMRQRSGSIVCISSGARDGSPWNAYYKGCSAYAAAKAGLHGFIRDVALELAEHGITVNAVSPGPIETERAAPHLHHLNATVERSPIRMTPMRRLGQPREIADAVLFLASAEASYITGHHLSVAGGL